MIKAGPVITSICIQTGYTRSHVARMMRENAPDVGAKKVEARWWIDPRRVDQLEKLVRQSSGKKRKLGERD